MPVRRAVRAPVRHAQRRPAGSEHVRPGLPARVGPRCRSSATGLGVAAVGMPPRPGVAQRWPAGPGRQGGGVGRGRSNCRRRGSRRAPGPARSGSRPGQRSWPRPQRCGTRRRGVCVRARRPPLHGHSAVALARPGACSSSQLDASLPRHGRPPAGFARGWLSGRGGASSSSFLPLSRVPDLSDRVRRPVRRSTNRVGLSTGSVSAARSVTPRPPRGRSRRRCAITITTSACWPRASTTRATP